MATNPNNVFADLIPQQPDQQQQVGFGPNDVLIPAPGPKAATATREPEEFHDLTAAEVAMNPTLDPTVAYRRNSAGKTEPIGPANPKQKMAQSALGVLRAAGVNLQTGDDPVEGMILGSTSGGLETSAANAYGYMTGSATSGMENIGRLKNLASEMVLQITGGSLGNQISNTDRDFIAERFGNIADPLIPANQRIASWREVKQRMGRYAGVDFPAPQAGAAGAAGADTRGVTAPPAEGTGGGGAGGAGGPDGGGPGAGGGGPGLSFDPRGNVIHPDTVDAIAGQDTGLVGEKGGAHVETNPALAGMNATVNEMLKARRPVSEIMSYIASKETDPKAVAEIHDKVTNLVGWQHTTGKDYKGDYRVDLERTLLPNTIGQNIVGSDVGQGVNAALDAATGFNLDQLAPLAGRDKEDFRRAQAAAAAAHPKATLAGTIAGGAAAAAAGGAGLEAAGLGRAAAAGAEALGEGGEAIAPLLARSVPTTAADLGYGTVAGAGATDYGPSGAPATVGERAVGAAEGALGAGIGSVIGQGIASPISAAARPAADEGVRALNEAGVPTTVGQQYGKSGPLGAMVKSTEDKATSLPAIGDLINARRVQGIKKYNEREFDKALEPIKEKAGGAIGNEGVASAQEKISGAYESALGGKVAQADKEFSTELEDAVNGLHEIVGVGPQVAQQVGEILRPYMREGSNEITGHEMQEISQHLRKLKNGYYAAGHVQKGIIGKRIDAIENAFFGPFKRQTPEVVPAYTAARVAQARLFTVNKAVLAAHNKEGIFLPSQLGRADVQATKKSMGDIAAGSGKSDFHDFQRAAQRVLPSSVPDSGSAGRLLTVAAASNPALMGKAAILAAIYSRLGQRLLTKPGRGFKSAAARRAAKRTGSTVAHATAAEGRREANQ